jgi:hypothetical protein
VGAGGGPGDCSTNADCPSGSCIELAPGGWKTCASLPSEATQCTMPAPPIRDQCCSSADCGSGRCYAASSVPYCAGAPMPEYNVCLSDQCMSDDDCIHDNPDPWICFPAGAYGYPTTTCRTAFCRTNADCTAASGGICAPIQNPCCTVPYGLACVYPGGCMSDQDCAPDGTESCTIDPLTGIATCQRGPTGCPL